MLTKNNLVINRALYNSAYYKIGHNYLINKKPINFQLLSSYEGIAFKSLAQCIRFDRTGRIFVSDSYLKRPKRFILQNKSGKAKGIMVSVSLPEFYKEIDYEDYILIDADSIKEYRAFLDFLSTRRKVEIVTFNKEQSKLIKSKFRIRNIHHWSVFMYPLENLRGQNRSSSLRLMNEGDLDLVHRLIKRVPEESSPFRSLKFQLGGLPFKNYAFPLIGEPEIIIGICPYCKKFKQINYVIEISPHADKFSSLALKIVARLIKKEGYNLVWRIRKDRINQYKSLIKNSNFIKHIKEYHIHLNYGAEI